MGKRAGKKRTKKQKETKENAAAVVGKRDNQQFTGKLILDKSYSGKLRSVVITQNMLEELSLQMMAHGLESLDGMEYKLYAVERLNRKEKQEDESVKFVPSITYKLTFKGDQIPLKMKIKPAEKDWCNMTLVMDCRPWYNNVIQCYKCLRYRHLSTTCKGYARCAKCGGRKENDHKCSPPLTLTCANCKGEHEAMDENCPVHLFHKDINKIIANKNVDYAAAVKIYNQCTKEDDTQTLTAATKVKYLDTSLMNGDLLKEMEKLIQALAIQENRLAQLEKSQQLW
uniref:Uncharacterized protein n=1 Tax=Cacopsylla melanoneura TaxID=428564 RepID=A0A8D8Y7N7_9HEMI